MLTGKREIFPTPCSSSAGSEHRNPSRPCPASNFVSVLNSSFIICRTMSTKDTKEHRILRRRCDRCVLCASSFQLCEFGFDLVEVGQLLRIVVALRVLDHAVLI